MAGKKVLVTGSGTGIGREVALEFAREGARVALHYTHSEKGAASAVQEILADGGEAAAFKADFASMEDVRQLGNQAFEFLGGIDVLVNNAGISFNLPFEEVTSDQFDLLYNVNVRGPFFLTQAAVALMEEQGGVVINTSSVHAYEGMVEHSIYAGTKGAIVAYTRQLAVELAPRGVRVNAIAPGAIVVDNYFKADPDFDVEGTARTIPCGFIGLPLDIARAAIFLASDDARFIIGQTIIVDGGTTSWMPFTEGFRGRIKGQFGTGYVPGF